MSNPYANRPMGKSNQPQTSGKATLSLVLGVLSLFLSCFTALPGLIVGFMALGDIKRSRGALTGKGMAIAGMVLSAIVPLVSLAVIGVLVALLLPAVQAARTAARTQLSSNDMKQIGLALHNSHQARRGFPLVDPQEGKLSWRVEILPYLEQQPLWRQFDLNQGPDAPVNAVFQDEMPNVFGSSLVNHPPGRSPIQVPVVRGVNDGPQYSIQARPGPEGPVPAGFQDIVDGTSNTIMTVLTDESRLNRSWIDAMADFEVDPNDPAQGMFINRQGNYTVLMADGSVRQIDSGVDPQTLRNLMQRNDGNVIDGQAFQR